jgi:RHS repeat-associated protein
MLSSAASTGTTSYTWDGECRPTQISGPDVSNAYLFNGDGQRVQVDYSGSVLNQVWDGQNILLEMDVTNTVVEAVYTLEPATYGNLISQSRSSGDSFYIFDGLGSTTILTTNTGSRTNQYYYDAFGNSLTGSGGSATNAFQYVGRLGYYAETDLTAYFLRGRMYDPATGRFISRDPLGHGGGDVNLYRYVFNRPLTYVDPTGAQGWEEVLLLCGAAALLFGMSGCQKGCVKTDPCAAACDFAQKEIDDGDPEYVRENLATAGGTVMCTGGVACPCVLNMNLANINYRKRDGTIIRNFNYIKGSCPAMDACTLEHEKCHSDKADCSGVKGVGLFRGNTAEVQEDECEDRLRSWYCMRRSVQQAQGDCRDIQIIQMQRLEASLKATCKVQFDPRTRSPLKADPGPC